MPKATDLGRALLHKTRARPAVDTGAPEPARDRGIFAARPPTAAEPPVDAPVRPPPWPPLLAHRPMTGKLIDRLVAAAVFVYALVVYVLTMAETTPFWDSGEFIAISNGLQVSHPPGAPFYMLLGRVFAMLSPLFSGLTDEPVAFAVNLMSPLASALTILLTHLIIVRLVRIWSGHPATWTGAQRIGANAGGVIGALTFAVTDSFWFNAVEAEVYAMSMLFTAVVVWLALVWRDATRAEEAGYAARGEHPFGLKADRYLLVIAYLFGLAIGVHLLNVLTLFFIALVVFFQKVDREDWTTGQRLRGMLVTAVVSAGLFFVIYPGVVQILPTLAGASGAPVLFLLAIVAACVWAVWWTQKRGLPVANLLALTVTLILVGYSSYGLIFVRSAADPPIDENDPETADAIVSYLKREQYGSTPLLSGPTYDDRMGVVNREREVTFPRRYSDNPAHTEVYSRYRSDGQYFWSYQLGHMYWRYFMWQFVGKQSDVQDAPWTAGFSDPPDTIGVSPSEASSYNRYWGLPLLLGLVGMTFHFQRDWRRALAVLALFLISGVGIILYLNQTPLQPRERDYSYVASFFAFAFWIGIGATGVAELIGESLAGRGAALRRGAALAVAAVLFLAVPGWMLVENYHDHDRSGRRIASDFAYNLLQSTAPNAVLFTNGDNDTFPLWYMQEVMGVRRDVRVVNLSLLNTPWYIRQLKNQASRESAPIPMTLTDGDINALGSKNPSGPLLPTLFTPQEVTLPVPASVLTDTAFAGRVTPGTGASAVRWRLVGNPIGQNQSALYTADLVVLDILRAVAAEGWQRPIYFASTVPQSAELNLQPYLQNEGLARRVVPFRDTSGDPDGTVVPEIARRRLAQFRYRGLNDPDVYLDENARNMADGYRSRLASVASGMARAGDPEGARTLLDEIRGAIPTATVPASFGSLYTMAEAYREAGDTATMTALLDEAADQSLARLEASLTGSTASQQEAFQYVQFVQTAYMLGGAYDAAAAFSGKLAAAVGDDRLTRTAAELRAEGEQLRRAQDSLDAGRRAAPIAPPDTGSVPAAG